MCFFLFSSICVTIFVLFLNIQENKLNHIYLIIYFRLRDVFSSCLQRGFLTGIQIPWDSSSITIFHWLWKPAAILFRSNTWMKTFTLNFPYSKILFIQKSSGGQWDRNGFEQEFKTTIIRLLDQHISLIDLGGHFSFQNRKCFNWKQFHKCNYLKYFLDCQRKHWQGQKIQEEYYYYIFYLYISCTTC